MNQIRIHFNIWDEDILENCLRKVQQLNLSRFNHILESKNWQDLSETDKKFFARDINISDDEEFKMFKTDQIKYLFNIKSEIQADICFEKIQDFNYNRFLTLFKGKYNWKDFSEEEKQFFIRDRSI
eukprot:TRINITY_DN2046_c0_g1_i1.p1 TRINITY_DN2046_c0_g1~~TRINITY_DN2046_c0_g1_i1.p1  ORF type:complete len:126 (-),score=27.31 TRINITY_DN2046_c0_g1_i1:117-494(-)